MGLRWLDQRLAPGIGAVVGGGVGAAIWGDPVTTVLSGALGATALALIVSGPSEDQPAPVEQKPKKPVAPIVPPYPGGLLPGQGRALLEQLPIGVVLIDGRGRIRFANELAREIFGRAVTIDQHGSALRVPKLVEAIDLCVTDRISSTIQFSMSRDADVRLRVHIRALEEVTTNNEDRSAPAVLVFVEDITQMHRAVDLHRDFVANASHELKTPLSSIAGIIQTLQGHARGDPQATERFLDMMATQADRMKRLVEDLLSLNRIELNERVPPREAQPVRRIVWEVADSLIQVAEESDVSLRVAAPQNAPYVLGNREELAQVFRNLIENAIKYGKPGTPVTIAVEPESPDRPNMIGISVSDEGPGIPREHIPRLTERFYRVSVSRSREKGGTGLGLAIVKHILNRHKGELEIQSEVGAGSKFTVWLPVTENSAEAEASSADAA
ncbi:PAS domain-containing protein [Rhodobacteraceae bacterium NNCM2]|nr:PAS domain-containing protein [Coraliihabitans acroporae]